MMSRIPDNLIVLEMANNHAGNLEHGLEIVWQFSTVCKLFPEFNFAFKFQYRDRDTFIHPSLVGRHDIKHVKRFSETRLTRLEFDGLTQAIRDAGYLVMATPFDEASVEMIIDQGLDILKIASCSLTDWPLLERAVVANLPIIASTAGAAIEEIDSIVSFLSHRTQDFAIQHCVADYPVADENIHIGQIQYLRNRYPGVRVGFSTHESPTNTMNVALAIAQGASILEKHVDVPMVEYPVNSYSVSPAQFTAWLESARHAKVLCGVGGARLPLNQSEQVNLHGLRRGVFARREIHRDECITAADVYFAFPVQGKQFTANDWSKYASFVATTTLKKDEAISSDKVQHREVRAKIRSIILKICALISKSGVVVPSGAELELSHHYGLDYFDEVGLSMLTVVNRSYCKKLLISLPGQRHPEQYHRKKEETFHVLFGEVHLTLDGKSRICNPGDVITIEAGVKHAFVSLTGSVIEEISSTHVADDSFYTDKAIAGNLHRKTRILHWIS